VRVSAPVFITIPPPQHGFYLCLARLESAPAQEELLLLLQIPPFQIEFDFSPFLATKESAGPSFPPRGTCPAKESSLSFCAGSLEFFAAPLRV